MESEEGIPEEWKDALLKFNHCPSEETFDSLTNVIALEVLLKSMTEFASHCGQDYDDVQQLDIRSPVALVSEALVKALSLKKAINKYFVQPYIRELNQQNVDGQEAVGGAIISFSDTFMMVESIASFQNVSSMRKLTELAFSIIADLLSYTEVLLQVCPESLPKAADGLFKLYSNRLVKSVWMPMFFGFGDAGRRTYVKHMRLLLEHADTESSLESKGLLPDTSTTQYASCLRQYGIVAGHVIYDTLGSVVTGCSEDELVSRIQHLKAPELTGESLQYLCIQYPVMWLSDTSNLIDSLLRFIKTPSEGKSLLPTVAPEDYGTDVDSMRVRAACIVLEYTSLGTMSQSTYNEWIRMILEIFFMTNDELLRLTAAEIVVSELNGTPAGLNFLKEEHYDIHFTEELGKCKGEFDVPLQVGLMKALSNVIERFPDMTKRIMTQSNGALGKSIQMCVNLTPSNRHCNILRPVAVSCIGCIASNCSKIGVECLNDCCSNWMPQLTHILSMGDDFEVPSVLNSILKMLGGSLTTRVCTSDTSVAEFDRVFTASIAREFVPPILTRCLNRPYAAVREFSFLIFLAIVDRRNRTPIESFAQNEELQLLLFAPLTSDTAPVKRAKHRFVTSAIDVYGDWLAQHTSSRFFEACKFYYDSGPYSIPPQFSNCTPCLATKV